MEIFNVIKQKILDGKTSLGIEFGSTRIKAILIDDEYNVIAMGGYDWENKYINDNWTYDLCDVWTGLKESYHQIYLNIKDKFGIDIKKIGNIGISGMMHGYLAFDKDGNLLVPFRTWRNTYTEDDANELSDILNFTIPTRWSASHLYHAIKNNEHHIKNINYITTLSGYIHWMLTGEKVIGIGDGSGIFPIDSDIKDYDNHMLDKFEYEIHKFGNDINLRKLFPKVLVAGENAGCLKKESISLIDVTGNLEPYIPFCPPEGDAGTGMVATNSIKKRTGNVSAGTSIFSMIVLDSKLKNRYSEIDMVTTPNGYPVAMVHANNCTSDINAWANLFREVLGMFNLYPDKNELFTALYSKSAEGDKDAGKLVSYNYISGESITKVKEGIPIFLRSPKSNFTLSNFMKCNIYSSLATLKIGLDILKKNEDIKIDRIVGHGGFFKTKKIGQNAMSAVFDSPVSVYENAGEGGAWGMAILASYLKYRKENIKLEDYLDKIFDNSKISTEEASSEDKNGFYKFMDLYKNGLDTEKNAYNIYYK